MLEGFIQNGDDVANDAKKILELVNESKNNC